MKRDALRVRLVKTHYPYWGSHTAFNAMLPRFSDSFRVTMREVSMRRQPPSVSERLLQPWLRRQRLQEYAAADLRAEISLLLSSLFSSTDIVMFLDAEHSLLFLPRWLRLTGQVRRPPKIAAMFHQPPSVLAQIINLDVARQADRVVAVAPAPGDYFARSMPAERVATILVGVDTGHFTPGSARRAQGKFRCLSGGGWLRDYGAVWRTAELLAGVPEIEFHVVGPSVAPPAALTNVIVHRGIPDAALLDLYQNCHALFLPLQDATANTFLLEGSACGLPIVSSELPSLRAYFPGEEAILVKDNDPAVFAHVLRELQRDSGRRRHMSACARQRALQLSWERIVPEYERLFRALAGI